MVVSSVTLFFVSVSDPSIVTFRKTLIVNIAAIVTILLQIFDNIIKLSNPINNFNNNTYFYIGVSLVTITLMYIMLDYIFQ